MKVKLVYIVYISTMKNIKFSSLASTASIEKATTALTAHGITVHVANNAIETKKLVHSLIPKGSEVMTATSTTLNQLGLTEELNDSGTHNSVKSQLSKLNRETDGLAMQKLGAGPEYIIGSVHAVTEDGKIIVASGSGSQLPAYTYGASHVIWVVSTKKIVKDLEEGLDRIYNYVLPQEDARMKSVYGPEASSHVNKLFILNNELNKSRINLIFVKEDLGF